MNRPQSAVLELVRNILRGIIVALFAFPALAATDPLPSWNDTPAKAAIISFVAAVSTEGQGDFVPAIDRVAVFESDGTLWVEEPIPAEIAFEMDCAMIVESAHPEWRSLQPFQSALERDGAYLAAANDGEIGALLAATHAGWTTHEYDTTLASWLQTTAAPHINKPYGKLAYQPMAELIAYLRANGFRTYVIAARTADFTRQWAKLAFELPPDEVLGFTVARKLALKGEKPELVRVPEIDPSGKDAGSPAKFQSLTGLRPVAAFATTDAAIDMLQWTTKARGRRLGVVIHHTDGNREFAYDHAAGAGRREAIRKAAGTNGWTVVDMQRDWRRIFSFEAP